MDRSDRILDMEQTPNDYLAHALHRTIFSLKLGLHVPYWVYQKKRGDCSFESNTYSLISQFSDYVKVIRNSERFTLALFQELNELNRKIKRVVE